MVRRSKRKIKGEAESSHRKFLLRMCNLFFTPIGEGGVILDVSKVGQVNLLLN
jgi:hypothetical protein